VKNLKGGNHEEISIRFRSNVIGITFQPFEGKFAGVVEGLFCDLIEVGQYDENLRVKKN